MREIYIPIGRIDEEHIRKINLADVHSILIAGGNESLRGELIFRIYRELVLADIETVCLYCLEQIEDHVAKIEAFSKEVDERYENESLISKEKVLIVDDYAAVANPYDKGPAYASRVKRNIEHIAKKGRTVGMHVIIVVGRPCVDVLTVSLKKNS